MALQGGLELGAAQPAALREVRGREEARQRVREGGPEVLHLVEAVDLLPLLAAGQGRMDHAREQTQHRKEAEHDVDQDEKANNCRRDDGCHHTGDVIPSRKGHDAEKGLHRAAYGPEPRPDLLGPVAPMVGVLPDERGEERREQEVEDEQHGPDPQHRGEGRGTTPGHGAELRQHAEEPQHPERAAQPQHREQEQRRRRGLVPAQEEEGEAQVRPPQQDQPEVELAPGVPAEARASRASRVAEPQQEFQSEKRHEHKLGGRVRARFERGRACFEPQVPLEVDVAVESLVHLLFQTLLQQGVGAEALAKLALERLLAGARTQDAGIRLQAHPVRRAVSEQSQVGLQAYEQGVRAQNQGYEAVEAPALRDGRPPAAPPPHGGRVLGGQQADAHVQGLVLGAGGGCKAEAGQAPPRVDHLAVPVAHGAGAARRHAAEAAPAPRMEKKRKGQVSNGRKRVAKTATA
mmetsp:Transcript_93068/g.245628  ORF Transcript_93068/g.245628 Transcript_93068/m.245628 type:complete len:462 (-) Transcript_93068:2-1387(-)